MRGRFLSGALIGAAIGMLLVPDMDRNAKRRLKRSARIIRSTAADVYDNMKGWAR